VTVPVSAVVITKDEAWQIQRCLESLKWTAEIIVVDAHSRDRTPELAERLGARVIQHEWTGYALQKNFAIGQVSQPWVLSIDADEEVSPALATEIQQSLLQDGSHAAYRIWRPTYFLGRPLRHYGRARHDPGQVRLFRAGQGRFQDRLVHERVEVDGPIGILRGPLLHHSYPNLRTYWRKIHRDAWLEAQQRATQAQVSGSRWARAIGKLAWMLVIRGGVLDGPRAWLWIAGQAYQEWLITGESARLTRGKRYL
jgi:glycosyltransferase involved in cell wall biosynthesis